MYKVRLTRIEGGEALRTKSVDGYAYNLPVAGSGFRLFAEPIDLEKDTRMVSTSTVKAVVND